MECNMAYQAQILATNTETNGTFGLVAYTLPPFYAGKEACHAVHQMLGYYVVAGIVAITRGDVTITLTAGSFVCTHPGEIHRYWNPSPSPTHLLLFCTPGTDAAALHRIAGGVPEHGIPPWDTS